MFLYQNGSLQHTQQLFKKSKKKSKSEKKKKLISFPFATRPPNIRIPLLWNTLLVVVLENNMIIVN